MVPFSSKNKWCKKWCQYLGKENKQMIRISENPVKREDAG